MKYILSILMVLAVGLGLSVGITSVENRLAEPPLSQGASSLKDYENLEESEDWNWIPTPRPLVLAQGLRSDPRPTNSPTATPTPTQKPFFTIEKFEPIPEEKTVLITFSEEVEMDDLRNRGDIEPYANLRWWNSSVQGKVLKLKGDFGYDKDYEISFTRSLMSKNRKTYRQTMGEFHMPDRPQGLEFSEDKTLIERNSRQMIHLDVVNIDEIQFEGLQVPPIALAMARALVEGSTPESLETVSKSIHEEYTRYAEALSASAEFSSFLREPVSDKNLFISPTERNIKKPFSVPLSFRKNPEKGTLELLQFRNNASDGTGETGARVYRITDLGLTYKLSQNQLLVWVTSIEKAQPMADVSLLAFDKEMKVYLLGKTSQDGILVAEGSDQKYNAIVQTQDEGIQIEERNLPFQDLTTLVAATEDDVNFIDFEVKKGVKAAGIEQAASRTALIDTDRGNLFTERGVYRPGETIHWKGTVRSYVEGSVVVPEEATCEIEIKDSKQKIAYKEDLSFSKFGTVSDDLELETFAPLGTYTMSLRPCSGEEEIAQRTFQVQEYRPPRHYVEIQFQRESQTSDAYINRDHVDQILIAKISGRYFAGGPLKNAKVRWRVFSTPSEFPQEDYPNYHFGYPTNQEGEFIETSESMLDESGEVEIRIPLGKSLLTSKHGLSFTATVVDFDGRTATKSADYSVTPKYLVGLSSPHENIQFGDPQVLRAIVLDTSGERVQSGTLKIRVLDRSYLYIRKRNREGNSYLSWESVWRDQYQTSIPIQDGEGVFDFVFNQSGNYLVECTYQTDDGEEFTTGSLYDVKGPWYWGDQERSLDFQPVQILPDKPEYGVGEDIRLLVKSGDKPSTCLLAIERDHVLEHRLVTMEDDEIIIPVSDDFRPNVYISILGIVPRGDFPTYEEEYDSEAPVFVYGAVGVKVRNEVGRLDIAIAPDEKELRAQPGDQMEIDLFVKDESGALTVAEVAVAVVDEQVLALTGYTTPNLNNLLDFKLPLSVFTGETRQSLQNQTPYEPILNQPITGGGGALLGYGVGIQLREDFNPVAYFNSALVTDASGHVKFSFEFPDTMTTYRVYAVACDQGGRFGSVQKPALVVKNFYLEPGAPRFFTRGDEFQFNISLFNHTDQEGPVEVEVDASENLSLDLLTPSPFMRANDQIQVPVKGTALHSGTAQLTVTGRFGEEEDGVRIEIPVESGLVIHKDIQYGTLTRLASIDYHFPEETKHIPWDEVNPEDFNSTLTLSGSAFLRLGPSLRYLLKYPYGCIEQTSSGVLPLAGLRSVIEKGLIPGFSVEEVDPFLQKGVDRIFSMQTDSGGFSYWPGNRTPDAWGTLYAVTALTFAKEAGIEIPENSMSEALDYLQEQAESSQQGNRRNTDYQTMAKYILAKAHHLEEQRTSRFDREYDGLGRESRFLALMTAKLLDLLPLNNIQSTLNELFTQAEITRTNLVFNAVYRERAVALLAGHMLQADAVIQQGLADQLLAAMKPSGRWTSTSDTGWSLLALGQYFGDLTTPIFEVIGHVSVTGEDDQPFRFEPASSQTFEIDPMNLMANPSIEVVSDASFPLSYQMELTYPRLDFAEKGYSNGFKVSKTIENMANSETIQVGDVVKVTIQFEADKDNRNHHVVIDDPLPAGLVAINSALATEEPVGVSGEDEVRSRYWEDGYYRFIPNHFEMRDTRVVAFRDEIWKGPYQYSYYARAVCEGDFRMPPTKVQLMYTPEICGFTPETRVEIEAQ